MIPYILFLPDGTETRSEVDWPNDPGYGRIAHLIEPFVGGRVEHVSVLYEGERRDMFVHEEGALIPLARNERATEIYRANWLSKNSSCPPESIPAIYGAAVLFPDRRVWF